MGARCLAGARDAHAGRDCRGVDEEPAHSARAACTSTAPLIPADVTTAISTIRGIVDAAKGGHWALLVGMVLTALVWAARRFTFLLAKVPDNAVPWVSFALGVAACVGTALASGAPIVDALIAGANVGGMGIAGWETVGKVMLPKKA